MGFGFSLIGIPLLLLLSVSLVLYFIFAKKRKALYALGILWGMVFMLILLAFALDQRRRPIQLTKADFVGDYRIDTTFYPGRNSRWQYHRFAFRILESDSILFLAINDKGTRINVFRHEILVGDGPHYFGTFLQTPRHMSSAIHPRYTEVIRDSTWSLDRIGMGICFSERLIHECS